MVRSETPVTPGAWPPQLLRHDQAAPKPRGAWQPPDWQFHAAPCQGSFQPWIPAPQHLSVIPCQKPSAFAMDGVATPPCPVPLFWPLVLATAAVVDAAAGAGLADRPELPGRPEPEAPPLAERPLLPLAVGEVKRLLLLLPDCSARLPGSAAPLTNLRPNRNAAKRGDGCVL